MDDEPYELAREEPDNASSMKSSEQGNEMSLSSDVDSEDDTAEDSDESRHMMTSNKEH